MVVGQYVCLNGDCLWRLMMSKMDLSRRPGTARGVAANLPRVSLQANLLVRPLVPWVFETLYESVMAEVLIRNGTIIIIQTRLHVDMNHILGSRTDTPTVITGSLHTRVTTYA